VNTFSVETVLDDGHVKSATLVQWAPPLHPTLRPHRLRVGLFDVEGRALTRRRAVELDVDGARTPLPQLAGEQVPDLLLVNDDDLTYTKVKLDGRSLKTLRTHLRGLDDDLARALAWGDLWDMVRDAQLRGRAYVAMTLANIDVETDASTIALLQGEIVRAIETYGEVANRAALREDLARAALERLSRTAPASDLQLLWASAFIGAARSRDDVNWVRGLLDGSTKVDGLKVDFAVRWSVVHALATIGAAGDELISAELQRDPTDQGQRAAASARAARPTHEAKAEAWAKLTAKRDVSLAMRRAIGAGFHRADQEALLSAFVRRYFDSLLPIWNSHPIEEALDIVAATYPRMIVTQEVVDLGDAWLARDLPGPIRRSLLEAQDGTKRALRARAFDGSRLPRDADQLLPKA
jgi:aminopeptidase N